MGTSAFRVRLAVALGLPLAVGCKSAPSPEPLPPTGGTEVAEGSGSATTPPPSPPNVAGLCPAEHVHERVCGTVFDDGSYAKVSAPAPLDVCPTTVAALRDFEENGIIDGWRKHPSDPGFENFRWDRAHSQAYEVNSGAGYQGDPRCCYERCTPLLCYGLASELGDRAVGPGPLALAEHSRALTLEDLAVEWFRDGCVNETVAALAVTEAARLAGTSALRATLDAIGADEATHAELSYRILDWALGIGGPALHVRIASEVALEG